IRAAVAGQDQPEASRPAWRGVGDGLERIAAAGQGGHEEPRRAPSLFPGGARLQRDALQGITRSLPASDKTGFGFRAGAYWVRTRARRERTERASRGGAQIGASYQ